MRFSLRINNDLPLKEYIDIAKMAEDLGFDQIWVANDLFLRSGPVIATAIGAATKHIEIGTSILNPYTIDPSEIAMFASTMDELTDCRFNLGIAAGSADFLAWIGKEHGKPLAAMRESIHAIRTLQSGERCEIDGKHLQWSNDCYLRFNAPRLTPIYLGAMGPGMLRLAGEVADGLLPLLYPPEHYFGIKSYVEEGLQRRQEDNPDFDFVASIWASLGETKQEARQVLAEKIAYYGPALGPLNLERLGLTREDFAEVEKALVQENDMAKASELVVADERMMKVGITGEPEDIIARLEPLVAEGVQHLSFGPPFGSDRLSAVKLLGEHVLPHFRK